MKYILRLKVRNQPGILARVAGLFNRRAYNIESFSSGRIDEDIYGMTISVICHEDAIFLIEKQLAKLIDVITVEIIKDNELINQEMLIIKINRGEIEKFETISKDCDTIVVEMNEAHSVYRCCGKSEYIENMIEKINQENIISINRSGSVAI